MRFRYTIRNLLWLTVVITGCGSPEPGVKITSFDVGTFDAQTGEFTATDVVPYKVGEIYGYQLSLSSTSGVVHLKEVLELPEPSTWGGRPNAPAGVKHLGVEITNNGKTQVEESEIDCGDNTVIYQQKYQIIKSD